MIYFFFPFTIYSEIFVSLVFFCLRGRNSWLAEKIAVARVNETGKDIQDLKEKEGRKKEVKKKMKEKKLKGERVWKWSDSYWLSLEFPMV